MEKKTMGSFLTALRKASGLTQKQLAEQLSVSDKAVSRWERDECAPDLSLIPVLAEIYGVTSDEILRGQRIAPEKLDFSTDHTKAVRQRKRILKSAKTKFTCRSLVTVALSLVGLILAYILNKEFSKANAGFLIGCIFFIAAAVSQILFLITGFASVSDEEYLDNSVENCKGFMLLGSLWCLEVITAAVALCIPLAGKSSVSLYDCILTGIRWHFVVTVAWVAISFTVYQCLRKNKIVDVKLPINKLRRSCSVVLILVMVALLGFQMLMCSFLADNKLLYAPYDTVKDLHQFKEIISEPKTEEGLPMYLHDDRNDVWVFYLEDYDEPGYVEDLSTYKPKTYRLHKDKVLKELIATEAEHPDGIRSFSEPYGYQFYHLNRTIVHYEVSNTDDLLPIYTYSTNQLEEADRIFISINFIYLLTYVIAASVTLIIYTSKVNRL